jgi:hypothetical protein
MYRKLKVSGTFMGICILNASPNGLNVTAYVGSGLSFLQHQGCNMREKENQLHAVVQHGGIYFLMHP